jgi:hypothetical protein
MVSEFCRSDSPAAAATAAASATGVTPDTSIAPDATAAGSFGAASKSDIVAGKIIVVCRQTLYNLAVSFAKKREKKGALFVFFFRSKLLQLLLPSPVSCVC